LGKKKQEIKALREDMRKIMNFMSLKTFFRKNVKNMKYKK